MEEVGVTDPREEELVVVSRGSQFPSLVVIFRPLLRSGKIDLLRVKQPDIVAMVGAAGGATRSRQNLRTAACNSSAAPGSRFFCSFQQLALLLRL